MVFRIEKIPENTVIIAFNLAITICFYKINLSWMQNKASARSSINIQFEKFILDIKKYRPYHYKLIKLLCKNWQGLCWASVSAHIFLHRKDGTLNSSLFFRLLSSHT